MASNQGDLPPSPHQVATNFQGARLPPTATSPSHLAKSPQLGSMCGDFSWRLPKSPHPLASADPQFECLWRLLMVTSKVATCVKRPDEASYRVATKSRHKIEKLEQFVRRQNEAISEVATKSRHSGQLIKTVAFHHGD
ncbi:hypothetical protein LWI29_022766 [Acer saccharum]|uniref:Uncharacterized protein n=1 Tax=Acer saccharum TaxID=4024 RepID=A0AA39S0E0_ACESA|nr:hypothetical protein LWI29_022766 [Acer saccharum]